MKQPKALPILTKEQRLNVVQELEQEIGISLVDGFQFYEARQNNIHLMSDMKLQREKDIWSISQRWNMSLELATESYDLAHSEQN